MKKYPYAKKWPGFLTAFSVAVAMIGCAWQGAQIQHNWQVQDQFDRSRLYAGYQYYTSGTLADPRAVMALKPPYRLVSQGWVSVGMTEALLAQWVAALRKAPFVQYNTFSNGARIVDGQGNIAGYFYSTWAFPQVRFPTPDTVMIRVPYPDYRWDNDPSEFTSDGGETPF